MKNEFVLAFNEVLEEKQLPRDVILKALESAMVSAYRRAVNASNAQQVEAKVDLDTGKVTIYAEKEVVEQVREPLTEVSLEEARRYNPNVQLGDMIVVESTPRDFGRVAAQTARQVIQQRIRDAERQMQLNHYARQVGEIVSGVVQAVNAQGLTIGLEMRAEGTMPRKEMIPGERFRVHDRVRALIAEVKDSPRGPQIILSRTHRNFLRRLLETEVPEIYHGIVEIRSIAREPGERAKVAVSATQPGIDPVGACVGIRGVRIQAIVRELHDEKIDVIEWNADPAVYIAKALSPARVTGVYLDDRSSVSKTATVVVPEDQLSLAIGRDGQNARLAAKLTGWRIDIKSLTEAAAEALHRLQTDPEYAQIAEVEREAAEAVSGLLARKAEGRPLSSEEYDRMAQFVDRVQRRASRRAMEKKAEEDNRVQSIRASIPAEAFQTSILDSGLPEHVAYLLQEGGFSTVGEVVMQMKLDPDQILKLQGIGPKAMSEITALVERTVVTAQPQEEPEAVAPSAEVAPVQMAVEPVTDETVAEPEMALPVETVEAVSQPEMAAAPVAEEETEELSFDELFTLRADVPVDVVDEEEEETSTDKKGKKSKKKKKGSRFVEYDPDRDVSFIRKKHKRGEDWDWE
ncbi:MULTISPECIES: transcription termination factor NusA [Anaerolinea]|uniref:transcription termination factor NusA n=1 Tax=Anaerolinea TaxID=233189 RepID=UPI00260CA6BD|nr:transcription termination factor NusA [Anaerolinea thermophila]